MRGHALTEGLPAESERAEAHSRITLGLLTAVEGNSGLSQRSLAKELGIALGVTNAYVKRCVRKGLIKVRHAPRNRYLYYLSPKGFTEKSRLTAHFLARSFYFYREARAQLDSVLSACAARGLSRVALCGVGELAEIALLCAMRYDVEIVGVVDSGPAAGRFMRVPLANDIAALGAVDVVLVTDLTQPQAMFEALAATLAPERILTPALLNIARGPRSAE